MASSVPRHRDRHQRAEHAGELSADQTESKTVRAKLHRSAVDERLQDVILELLVGKEEANHDDRPDPIGLDKHDRRDDDCGQRGPREGDEVEIPTRSPRAMANSLPTPNNTAAEVTPATRLIRRLPVT